MGIQEDNILYHLKLYLLQRFKDLNDVREAIKIDFNLKEVVKATKASYIKGRMSNMSSPKSTKSELTAQSANDYLENFSSKIKKHSYENVLNKYLNFDLSLRDINANIQK